jgi:cell division protein FtsB
MTSAAQTEAPVRTDSFRPVLGATVLLVLALLAIAGLKSSRDLESARARERLLEKRIAATRAESERLRVRIDRLRHDPGMLERLAREDLGMVRPGDVIVELPEAGGTAPAPRVLPPAAPPAQAAVPVAAPVPIPAAGSAGPAAPPAVPEPRPAASPHEPG